MRNLRKHKSGLWLMTLTLLVSLIGCVPAALASAEYTPLKVPALAANSERIQALGGLKIVADAGSLSAGDVLIINLPDEVTLTHSEDYPDAALFEVSNAADQAPNLLFVPDSVSGGGPNGIKADDIELLGVEDDEIRIMMLNDASIVNDAYLYLYLRSVIVGDRASGKLVLSIDAPAGSGFVPAGKTDSGNFIQGNAPQKSKPQKPEKTEPEKTEPEKSQPEELQPEITPAAVFTLGRTEYLVGGQTRTMDVAPYISGDRIYLPLRYAGYALGIAESDVLWDDASKTATLTLGDKMVQAKIGSPGLLINGETLIMDVAPQIRDDRIMLPFRFIGQAFDAEFIWDDAAKTVTMNL